MRVACEAPLTSMRSITSPFNVPLAFFLSLRRVFFSFSPLSTSCIPRGLRTVRYPPPRPPSLLGIGLRRPMRLASGPRALRLLVAIGSHRASPCRIVVVVFAFRAFYSVVRRVVLSIWPLRRGIVLRSLVLKLT